MILWYGLCLIQYPMTAPDTADQKLSSQTYRITPKLISQQQFGDVSYDLDMQPERNAVFVANGLLGVSFQHMDAPAVGVTVQASGCVRAVRTMGIFVFAADNALTVFDSTDFANPTKVFSGLPPRAHDYIELDVEHKLLFMTGYQHLQIVNVNDPLQPKIISELTLPDNGWMVTLYGQFLYVAGGASGLVVVNITDVTKPVIAQTMFNDTCQAVTVVGRYAYVALDRTGIVVLDLEDGMRQKGVLELGIAIQGLKVYANQTHVIAYAACASRGLRIADVTNVQDMKIIGAQEWTGDAYDIVVYQGIALLSDKKYGVRVINVNNPQYPQVIDYWGQVTRTRSISISKNIGFVADNMCLIFMDYSDVTAPSIIDRECSNLQEDYILVQYINGYLYSVKQKSVDGKSWYSNIIIDQIDDLSKIKQRSRFSNTQLQCRIYSVVVSDNLLFVTCGQNGLQVIDITSRSNPVIISVPKYSTTDIEALDVAISIKGRYKSAYLTDMFCGLVIYNVTIADQIKILNGGYNISNVIGVPTYATMVMAQDNYIYVSLFGFGIVSINIAWSGQPFITCIAKIGSGGMSAVILGNLMYVADIATGILILDISDPMNITTVGSMLTSGEARELEIRDCFAYLADVSGGLKVVQVSCAQSLEIVVNNSFLLNGNISSISVFGVICDSGLRRDMTQFVVWSSSNSQIADFVQKGQLQAKSVGIISISASLSIGPLQLQSVSSFTVVNSPTVYSTISIQVPRGKLVYFSAKDFIAACDSDLKIVKITRLPLAGTLRLTGAIITSVPTDVPIDKLNKLSLSQVADQQMFEWRGIDTHFCSENTATAVIQLRPDTAKIAAVFMSIFGPISVVVGIMGQLWVTWKRLRHELANKQVELKGQYV